MNPQAYEQGKRRLKELTRLLDAILKKNSIVNENGERVMNFTDDEKQQQYFAMLEEFNILSEQIGNKQILLD